MNQKNLDIKEKPDEKSATIFRTIQNKDGATMQDTRQVFNVVQLEGQDITPEVTLINPREDFMLEKTLDGVLGKIAELKFACEKIDLPEIAKDAKQNAFNLCREQDALKQQRISDIQNIDLNAKPKNYTEKLQQFCKKSMQSHNEGYKGYVIDGVKKFLLSSPDTKLESMTKLIDAVAPAAVFNSKLYCYSTFVKNTVKQDKKFQQLLADSKKSRAGNSR